MKDYSDAYAESMGNTGTLGECVKAIAEVDDSPNEYYISAVQDELSDLLESYDDLSNQYGILSANIVIKKVKELLEEKIKTIKQL
tara:strand:- start:270 stop:524 length:255 start_codon:yes stop_codon:yes gene_type:complete